jgi:hypothetical protein
VETKKGKVEVSEQTGVVFMEGSLEVFVEILKNEKAQRRITK